MPLSAAGTLTITSDALRRGETRTLKFRGIRPQKGCEAPPTRLSRLPVAKPDVMQKKVGLGDVLDLAPRRRDLASDVRTSIALVSPHPEDHNGAGTGNTGETAPPPPPPPHTL